jgi:anti-sigma-K factor RskA
MPVVTAAPLPTDPEGRAALAGEYVLGTLDARSAARIAVALQSDPAWREAVESWERQLAPLALLARPEAPPPDSWDRIETRINPHRAASRRSVRVPWLWRGWAMGASLAAAGLAAFILVPRAPPPRLMTVLLTDRNDLAFVADVDRKGELRLAAVPAATGREPQAPSGKSLQLWGLPPGATVPANLGVLPNEPGRVMTIPTTVVHPVAGMLIEISLEPEGGSPTGRATGPVVFYGRLVAAGRDS